ncbi:dihydroorotate oxidase domain protein [Leptospira interrogans serovar Pyrogenes str. L0374]|nr:dihydroorotate oxidase domain protein [Leptospira interrogans serovar Pyrogenes str. L0374]EMY26944.1 dihydroorotate oxidase domain protein [Leptospira interrogans serovar Australis str. 200703203]
MFLPHLRQSAYSVFLKPFFLSLDPETAHELAKNFLGIGQKFPGFLTLMESMTSYQSDRLKTKIAGIEFENPLGMGAGFDKTGELYPFLSRMGFGHIEVGTITGQKQSGNPKPRVFRYPQDQALVNRMGFNNPGADSAEKIISSQKKQRSEVSTQEKRRSFQRKKRSRITFTLSRNFHLMQIMRSST